MARGDSAPRRYGEAALRGIVADLLAAAGASPANAAVVAEHLVEAEMCGHGSHGLRLTAGYVDRLLAGSVDGEALPGLASEDGAILRVAGNRAFGQIVGDYAVGLGVAQARRSGVCLVAIAESGHLGRNGRWPERAAAAGIASLHFVNGPGNMAAVAPFGGRERRLGTGPMALGMPGGDGDDVILDFALAEVSSNTARLAMERGERLPAACVVDPAGQTTDDPAVYVDGGGALLPFGGFKGYGLAVFTQIFAGILAGGGSATQPTNSMLSIYFDVERIMPRAGREAAVAALLAAIRDSAPVDGPGPLAVPGDRSRRLLAEHRSTGIAIDAALPTLRKAAARVDRIAALEQALAG